LTTRPSLTSRQGITRALSMFSWALVEQANGLAALRLDRREANAKVKRHRRRLCERSEAT
jgi:hypothetical protein